jgi:hypothetical protein
MSGPFPHRPDSSEVRHVQVGGSAAAERPAVTSARKLATIGVFIAAGSFAAAPVVASLGPIATPTAIAATGVASTVAANFLSSELNRRYAELAKSRVEPGQPTEAELRTQLHVWFPEMLRHPEYGPSVPPWLREIMRQHPFLAVAGMNTIDAVERTRQLAELDQVDPEARQILREASLTVIANTPANESGTGDPGPRHGRLVAVGAIAIGAIGAGIAVWKRWMST